MTNPGDVGDSRNSGIVARVTALLRDMSALFKNRLELASLELAETGASLLKALLITLLGLLAAWFALAFWSGLLVFFAWPVLGWKILLILALAFTVGGLAALRSARAILRRLELLPVTRAELRKDMDVFVK